MYKTDIASLNKNSPYKIIEYGCDGLKYLKKILDFVADKYEEDKRFHYDDEKITSVKHDVIDAFSKYIPDIEALRTLAISKDVKISKTAQMVLNYGLSDINHILYCIDNINTGMSLKEMRDSLYNIAHFSLKIAQDISRLQYCLDDKDEILFTINSDVLFSAINDIGDSIDFNSKDASDQTIRMDIDKDKISIFSKNGYSRKKKTLSDFRHMNKNIGSVVFFVDTLWSRSYEYPGLLNLFNKNNQTTDLNIYIVPDMGAIYIHYKDKKDNLVFIEGGSTDIFPIFEDTPEYSIGVYYPDKKKHIDIVSILKQLSEMSFNSIMASQYVKIDPLNGLMLTGSNGYAYIKSHFFDFALDESFKETLYVPVEDMYNALTGFDTTQPINFYYKYQGSVLNKQYTLYFQQGDKISQIVFRSEHMSWALPESNDMFIGNVGIKDIQLFLKKADKDDKYIDMKIINRHNMPCLHNNNTVFALENSDVFGAALNTNYDIKISDYNAKLVTSFLKKIAKYSKDIDMSIAALDEIDSYILKLSYKETSFAALLSKDNSFGFNRLKSYSKTRSLALEYNEIFESVKDIDERLWRYPYDKLKLHYEYHKDSSDYIDVKEYWQKNADNHQSVLTAWNDINKRLYQHLDQNPYYHINEIVNWDILDIFNTRMDIFKYPATFQAMPYSIDMEKTGWVDAYTNFECLNMGLWYIKSNRNFEIIQRRRAEINRRTIALPMKQNRKDVKDWISSLDENNTFEYTSDGDKYRFYFPEPYQVLEYFQTSLDQRRQYEIDLKDKLIINGHGKVLFKADSRSPYEYRAIFY